MNSMNNYGCSLNFFFLHGISTSGTVLSLLGIHLFQAYTYQLVVMYTWIVSLHDH
jgi:ABC-type iron transport system FetAB permease component